MNIFNFKQDGIETHWLKIVLYGWLFFLIVIFIFIYHLAPNKLFAVIPSIILGAIASVYLIGFPYRIYLNIKYFGARKEKVKETLFCVISFIGLTCAWYWVWQARDLL